MSRRAWQERIRDILDAIEQVQTFTRDMNAESFAADTRTQRAVEMNFIVIGEAATNIPQDIQEQHADVPWSLMRAMLNRLVHVYFNVDPLVVWGIVQDDLPSLVEPLQQLLERDLQ